jgi:fructose-bisphosphate aldolase class II/tagatose 1,6-diphosphate aldolase GatY/KbaY
MILRGHDVLVAARSGRSALGAFSVYNLELARAVRLAAEQTGLPLIMQTGAAAVQHLGSALCALVVAEASDARADIGIHLDHARTLDDVRTCLDAGYSSVMIDGSALPFVENVALTRAAVRLAGPFGAWVEGELGGIAGDEDRSTPARPESATDPSEAARFVEETGVAALAVAVGNVHGIPAAPVSIDLDRLGEIAESVDVPLVLHGASGLEAETLRQCITLGVSKVNVNTEVRVAYLGALRTALAGTNDADDLLAVHEPAIGAAAALIAERQRLFWTRSRRRAA